MYYSFNIISLILTLIFIENVNGFLWDFLFPLHKPFPDTYDSYEDSNENYYGNRRYYIFKPKPPHRHSYRDSESDEDNSAQYIITHHRPKKNYDDYYDDDENDSSGSSNHLSALVQRRDKDDYLHKRQRKCRGKSSLSKLLTLLFGSLQKTQHLPEAGKPGKKNDMYIHVELLKDKPKRKRWPKNKRKSRRIRFKKLSTNFKNQNGIESEENENLRIKRSASRKVDVNNNHSTVPDTRNNLQSIASQVKNSKTTTERPKSPVNPRQEPRPNKSKKGKKKGKKNGKKSGKKNGKKNSSKKNKKNQKKKSNKKKSNSSKFVKQFPSFFHNPYAPYL